MKPATTAPAEKIFACYIDYIHAEKVIAITNPKEETLIAPIVASLVEAQVDVLPVYQQAVQQCEVVHQLLEEAFKKHADNKAIQTNMHRSHWFMALLYYKINLLDKAKAQYTEVIQMLKKHYAHISFKVKPISYACLAYLNNTSPRADACKTRSGESVVDERQYDSLDPRPFYWSIGHDYFDVHYAICKVLSQQHVAPETILQALQQTCTYMMINYHELKEHDKLAIVAKVLCGIHALHSGNEAITSGHLHHVMEDLSAIYIVKLNPTDDYTDLQVAYRNCLELHDYALDNTYSHVIVECAIRMGHYVAKEGDKQGVHTYFTAAYDLIIEYTKPDIYPDSQFDWERVAELAESFAKDFEKLKMYSEAIEFYDKSRGLNSVNTFDVASLYLAVHRLDDALAYYHEGKVYAEIDRDTALKIDQITSILHIEDDPEVVRPYRERFYGHCGLSKDTKWLDLSDDDLIIFTIWEGETRIGYCCISRWHYLREYYIAEAYQHKMAEILRQMIDIELVEEALLSTTHTPAYTVCLSESYYSSEKRFCYTYSGKANAKKSALAMQLAREEDIEKIIKFYQKNSWYSRDYDKWARMVKRREVYLCIKEDVLIAVGECTTDDTQPDVAEVEILVARVYRQQGLGAGLLTFLTDKAIEQGRCPVTTVEYSYGDNAAKRLVERCGFECRAVVVEMGL